VILIEDFGTLQEGGTGDLPVILPVLQLAGVHVTDLPHGQTVIQLRKKLPRGTRSFKLLNGSVSYVPFRLGEK
jgi:hypothetical protein